MREYLQILPPLVPQTWGFQLPFPLPPLHTDMLLLLAAFTSIPHIPASMPCHAMLSYPIPSLSSVSQQLHSRPWGPPGLGICWTAMRKEKDCVQSSIHCQQPPSWFLSRAPALLLGSGVRCAKQVSNTRSRAQVAGDIRVFGRPWEVLTANNVCEVPPQQWGRCRLVTQCLPQPRLGASHHKASAEHGDCSRQEP